MPRRKKADVIVYGGTQRVAWNFTDTGQVSAEGERVVQTFEQDIIYTVSLLVTDTAGRRRLVPVGLATTRDVTLDDFDADLAGRWNGTFPQLLPSLRCAIRMSSVAPAFIATWCSATRAA